MVASAGNTEVVVELNAWGQPVGDPVPGWTPRPRPTRATLVGRFVRLEPLDPAGHGDALRRGLDAERDGRLWTYLSFGPFADVGAWPHFLDAAAASEDPLYFTVVSADDPGAVGLAAYLRIEPAAGSIEVGSLAFSPALQQTTAATEAMVLMMAHAFDELGYRRYEWKCDSLNAPSRRAAERLGFGFEGIFSKATVVRGRNRDTAWYAITDAEWPRLRDAYAAFLDPTNFDSTGTQRVALGTWIDRARRDHAAHGGVSTHPGARTSSRGSAAPGDSGTTAGC